MQTTDDPQDALDLWNADDTQWLLTTVLSTPLAREDALHALRRAAGGWRARKS